MSTITGLYTLDAAASTNPAHPELDKDKVRDKEREKIDVARYTPSPTWGRAWHTCVHVVFHLICQGAALEWIQAHLKIFGQVMVIYFNLFNIHFFIFS